MSNPSAFFDTLEQQLPAILAKLQDLNVEALARQSGFLERCPRKIPILNFLQGLLAVAPENHLSLEHIASVIGLAANTTYSKQALSDRLCHNIELFLVMFRDRAALERIYPTLVRHAVMSFGSEQVLRFMGRVGRAHGHDEVQTDRRRGPDGVRIKHWLNKNSLKAYDKGSVFRTEATINEPKDFRVSASVIATCAPNSLRLLRTGSGCVGKPRRSVAVCCCCERTA